MRLLALIQLGASFALTANVLLRQSELRRHERTGRPLGSEGFRARLERMLGRVLHPARPGRKPKR